HAFDERLAAFVSSLFDERRGAISTLLPPPALAELRGLLLTASEGLMVRLDTYLASDAFRVACERWVELLKEEVRERPMSELLTDERRNALTRVAERWLAEAAEGDAFSTAIRDYVDRGTIRLLRPDRTFEQLLPQ